MHHLRTAGVLVGAWFFAAMGLYELTAKSPDLFGTPLPGWQVTDRVEKSIRWDPPTGLLVVDKLLHEGQEAAAFYAAMARPRIPSQRR